MASSTEEEDEKDFYFESDHLALRGNRDYMKLLRTLAVLQTQRTRAHKDLEDLLEARRRYMDDPELCLQKLRNNEPIVAPYYFTTINIPEITGFPLIPPDDVKIKEEPETTQPATKSETQNRQLWSCDEQRRLEELLIEYPAETFESRRFAKIAKALGNRTPQQVSSRVQKYFQKLYEAGMPIPGRIPKKRRQGVSRAKNLYRPSTFFPAHMVPVQIPEDDDDMPMFNVRRQGGMRSSAMSSHGSDSNVGSSLGGEPVGPMSKDGKNRMVSMLRAIRDEKKSMLLGYYPDPLAPRCEDCEVTPVSRCVWYCKTCQFFLSYCTDCLTTRLLQNRFTHINHIVEATETPEM